MQQSSSIEDIYQWLDEVKDPEIPVLSIVDLGVITNVHLENNEATIEMTPTFTGCPAIDVMREEIITVLRKRGLEKVTVEVTFRIPWSSDRISEKGKTALRNFGLAPPTALSLFADLDIIENAICPRCAGTNTDLKTVFGSTLCRSIFYCHTCKESFEQFKAI